MRRRGATLLLVLTLIICIGTIIQDFRFDSSIARERADALATERSFGAATEALSELRAAQAGYVASGQGPAFWLARVSDFFAKIDKAIDSGRTATTDAGARTRYDAAATALTALNAIDQRARGYLGQNDRLYVSDLIFMDSRESSDKLVQELAAARSAEHAASEARIARLSRLRLAMNAVAIAFVFVVAWYLSRPGAPVEAKPAPTTLQMLRDLPPPVKNTVAPPAAPTPIPPAPRMINLTAAAELCVDLARVIDGRDVPSLVERAAAVLEAKGVVLWIADEAGTWLHPSITHGYPEKVVGKLGPLQIDSDNVTSLAFRSLKPQAMSSTTPGASGAIAAPLITSSGCVGVLAAEIRQNRPGSDVLPIASIIAAQLAALVVPGETAGQHVAQG